MCASMPILAFYNIFPRSPVAAYACSIQFNVGLQSIHDPMTEAVSVGLGRLKDELLDSVNSLLYDGDYVLREDNAGELLTYVQVRHGYTHD